MDVHETLFVNNTSSYIHAHLLQHIYFIYWPKIIIQNRPFAIFEHTNYILYKIWRVLLYIVGVQSNYYSNIMISSTAWLYYFLFSVSQKSHKFIVTCFVLLNMRTKSVVCANSCSCLWRRCRMFYKLHNHFNSI